MKHRASLEFAFPTLLRASPWALLWALAWLLAASPARAAPPAITTVAFTPTGTTFSATVSGTRFGAAPAGIPCTACAIPEFSLVAPSMLTQSLSYNITSWTSTRITLTGISGMADAAVFATVTNDSLKDLATWGGNFPGTAKKPKIKSVTFAGSGATLQMTITGTGFGAKPAGVPGTGDIPFFNFLEWSVSAPGQFNYPWAAGWTAQGITDTVTLHYTSWTSSKIVISGFAGAYGTDGFVETKNDPFLILLWMPPGIVPGSTGPQTAIGGRLPQ